MAEYQWAFWILGGLAAATGLALTIWALLWDRPRGRLRCPACWYDLSGLLASGGKTLPICPECGQAPAKPKHLRRTRRRPLLACLGALLLLIGSAGTVAPQLIEGDLLAAVPSPILHIVLAFQRSDARAAYEAATSYTLGAAAPATPTTDLETWSDLLVVFHAGRLLTGDARGHTDRRQALRELASAGSEARIARSAVIDLLRDESAPVDLRKQAAQVLGELDDWLSRRALRRWFRSPEADASLRLAALAALEANKRLPMPLGEALSQIIRDPIAASEAGRRIATLLPREEAVDRLLAAMRAERIETRQGAYTGFAVLGPRAGYAAPELTSLARAEVTKSERNTARALWSLAAVSDIPAPYINELIEDGSPEGRKQIAGVLSRDDALAAACAGTIVDDLLRTDRPFCDPLRRVLERHSAQAVRALHERSGASDVAEQRRLLLLCRMTGDQPVTMLGALEDPDRAVRRLAIETLTWIDSAPFIDAIVNALRRERDDQLKYALAWHIADAKVESDEAVAALSGLTGTPAEPRLGHVALQATEAASRAPRPIIEQALVALEDPHPPTRYLACHVLKAHADAARADPRTRDKLNALLNSPDEPVRRSAVETINALWPERATGGGT